MWQRFSSTVASPKRGPGVAVPLAIAGVAGAVYYCYYRSSVEKPVAATSKRTLTNPNEWMDFKVSISQLPIVSLLGPLPLAF